MGKSFNRHSTNRYLENTNFQQVLNKYLRSTVQQRQGSIRTPSDYCCHMKTLEIYSTVKKLYSELFWLSLGPLHLHMNFRINL